MISGAVSCLMEMRLPTGWLAIDPVILGWIRASFAVLFVSAAVHKLRDRASFRVSLAAYRLVPPGAVEAVALGLAGLECALGVGMLVAASSATSAIAGALLLAVYAGAIAINLGRGRTTIDCGCGGPGGARPIAPALVARNAMLAALLLVSLLPPSARAMGWLDGLTIVFAVAASAFLYAAADVAIANAARLRGVGGLRWSTP